MGNSFSVRFTESDLVDTYRVFVSAISRDPNATVRATLGSYQVARIGMDRCRRQYIRVAAEHDGDWTFGHEYVYVPPKGTCAPVYNPRLWSFR